MRPALVLAIVLVLAAPARAIANPEPHIVGEFPATVTQVAEPLAQAYIAAHHWTDTCAGIPPVALLADNLDAVAGLDVDGLTFLTYCTMYGDATTIADDPAAECATYVHERLHLARNDDWHNTTDPHDPLYAADSNGDGLIDSGYQYAPCTAAYAPATFTWRQARRAVRNRLRHAARWRLEATEWTEGANGRRVSDVRFVARARKLRRVYVVTRPQTTSQLVVSRRR